MKKQLLLEKKPRVRPHQKDKEQTRFLNVSSTEEAENNEAKLKVNSLEVNDFVKLFDCSDIVFKGWHFYEDSFTNRFYFRYSKLEKGTFNRLIQLRVCLIFVHPIGPFIHF